MNGRSQAWDLDGLLSAYETESGSAISRSLVSDYIKEGLLPPQEEGDAFGRNHLERLLMIEHLRSRYGMSSQDISGIFGVVITTHEGESQVRPEVDRQTADRRQRIIANASELFAARGYHGTTIDEIVQATGIAKGTFYVYFSSKEELLVELMKQLITNTLERIDSGLERKGTKGHIARIETMGEEFLQLYLENSELLYMLIGETVGNPRLQVQLREIYQQLAETVEKDLQAGREAGEIFPYPDMKTIAYALVGMGQSAAIMLSAGGGPQMEKVRKTVHRFLQRAFSVEEA